MPQGLGKNLYFELSVFENIDFFAQLFGLSRAERRTRIDALLKATGLGPFPDRPAGKLSGGMKQKVGLCSALDPRPRPAHPRRAHHRRRPALAAAVLDAHRPHPGRAAGDERARLHRLHGRSRALRLAHRDGRRPDPRHRHARGTQAKDGHREPRRRVRRPVARRETRQGAQPDHPAARRDRRGAGHRRQEPHAPLREVHRRQLGEFHHRARRDLRLPRLQRLRQVDDDEDADRPPARHRRRGEAVRQARGRQGQRRPDARGLHVAGLLALRRADGRAEPLDPRPALSPAPRVDAVPHRRAGPALWPRAIRRRPSRIDPAGRAAAAFAGRGRHPRPGDADPRRADVRRRPGRARRVLGVAHRPLAREAGHDLHLDPLHERGDALRPDLADARGRRAGVRHPVRPDGRARDGRPGGSLHRLHRRRRGRSRQGGSAGGRAGRSRRAGPIDSRRRSPGLAIRLSSSAGCSPTAAARRSRSCATRCGWRSRSSGRWSSCWRSASGSPPTSRTSASPAWISTRRPESRAYLAEFEGSAYFPPAAALHSQREAEQRLRANDISLAIEMPTAFGRNFGRGARPEVSAGGRRRQPVPGRDDQAIRRPR